jgi:hypothetical protein
MNIDLEDFNKLIEINQDQPLSTFISVFEDAVPKELCESTIEAVQEVSWSNKLKYDYPNEYLDSRYGAIGFKTRAGNKLDIDFLTKQYETTNERTDNPVTMPFESIIYEYLFQYYNFTYDCEWYGAWFNFTQARINKYETGMFMEKHCDHFRTMFDGIWRGVPIYSVILMLNDDYEGGDLVFWDNEVIPKKQGNAVVFPSNFLFPHKVTEVTKGTRYSISSYAY